MQLIKSKYTSLFLIPILIAIGVLALPSQKVFAATTYTVNSIGDDSDATPGDSTCETSTPGECTLRAAIEEVNAGSGGDTINFNISGAGVHTFTPASAYEDITQSVTIDGYSQTGAVANTALSPQPFNGTLTIEIDGTSAGTASGLVVRSSNVTIKGLVINRFKSSGIGIGSVGDTKIEGNYIGTDPTGLIDRGNTGHGIYYASNRTGVVGGTTATARNIISGNEGKGIVIGSNLTVQGNYFGVNASGTNAVPNTGGEGSSNVYISGGNNNTIGGSTDSAANVIAGSAIGIMFNASYNNIVQGNYVGTNPDGNVQSGFGAFLFGIIFIASSQNNLIGGTSAGDGNIIAGNGSGVALTNYSSFEALNNSILGNSIHDNSGGTITALGIDLLGVTNDFTTFSDAGVTPNDDGDTDELSNHLMNFPVISSVSSSNGTATITYSLDINDSETGATGYRVEFFANDSADSSGHGQGQTFLGYDNVSGDVTNRQATITLPDGVSGTKYITATTTMSDTSDDGFGHTSEFAADVTANLLAASSGDNSDSSSTATLADTGENTTSIALLATTLLSTGLALGLYSYNGKKAKGLTNR